MTDTDARLIERLRAKHQVFPVMGGGSIGTDANGKTTATSYITDDGKRLANPDGPEAAARIESLTAEVARLREALPTDIAEAVLRMGKVDWGRTDELTDKQHAEDFATSLRLTREHFGLEGSRELHGLYLTGTDTALCHTGTSPNSAANAQALAGAWNWLVDRAALGDSK